MILVVAHRPFCLFWGAAIPSPVCSWHSGEAIAAPRNRQTAPDRSLTPCLPCGYIAGDEARPARAPREGRGADESVLPPLSAQPRPARPGRLLPLLRTVPVRDRTGRPRPH